MAGWFVKEEGRGCDSGTTVGVLTGVSKDVEERNVRNGVEERRSKRIMVKGCGGQADGVVHAPLGNRW